jgi:cyclopropane fatty-acyl-phospholipid synthase-like methyltransferase
MKAYKTIRDIPPTRRAKAALGRALAAINPTLAARVREKPFTQELKPLERLIRNARQHQAIAEKDHETLHRFLIDYWASPFSQHFFEMFAARYEELFLRYHADIVPALAQRLKSNEMDQPIHLLELGCGDGKVLHYLHQKLPQVTHFTGLDLSAEEIAQCQTRYPETPALQFATTEVTAWLDQHPREPLVFYTNGGVLEYFTREQLVTLFQKLAAHTPHAWVVLTETLATDHLLDSEKETFPYGHELAFSHNYPAILRECGFIPEWTNDRFTEEGEENHPTRWLQLIAETPLDRML